MIDIRKILVPTDFSPSSLRALEYAKTLGKTFGAELLLVHVVEPPLYPAVGFDEGAISWPTLEEKIRTAALAQLDKLVAAASDEGVEAVGRLESGRAFDALLRIASSSSVDLIVVATHGHTGLRHVLLGSTAEKLVRMATCPVLTVRSVDE